MPNWQDEPCPDTFRRKGAVDKTPRRIRNYSWRRLGNWRGRGALNVMYSLCEHHGRGVLWTIGDRSQLTQLRKAVWMDFQRLLPWFAEHYYQACGRRLTPNIMYNRLNKMTLQYNPMPYGWKDETGTVRKRMSLQCVSSEHPLHSHQYFLLGMPYIAQAEQWVAANQPIAEETIREAYERIDAQLDSLRRGMAKADRLTAFREFKKALSRVPSDRWVVVGDMSDKLQEIGLIMDDYQSFVRVRFRRGRFIGMALEEV